MADSRPSTLICVPPADVPKVWPAVETLIDQAYAAVDEITPDVRTWLIEEKGLLWIAVHDDADKLEVLACLTTSLVQCRSGLACRMVAAAGDGLDYCLPHLSAIELYAAAEGCCKVFCEGRSGWGRVLRGYVPKTVRFERRL